MEGRVGAIGRSEQGQAVPIGHQPMAWGVKGEVTLARQRNAERPPVYAAVEQAETTRVDVCEDSALIERRQIEREPLDLRVLGAGARGRPHSPLVDGTESRLLRRLGGWAG